MTTPPTDPVRTFAAALSWRARHLLAIDQPTAGRLHHAAERGADMTAMAAVITAGIGKYSDDNAAGLLKYRLERELRRALGEDEGSDDA